MENEPSSAVRGQEVASSQKWRAIYEAGLSVSSAADPASVLDQAAKQTALLTNSQGGVAAILGPRQRLLAVEAHGISKESARHLVQSFNNRQRQDRAYYHPLIRNDYSDLGAKATESGEASKVRSFCVVPAGLESGRLLLLVGVNKANDEDYHVAETDILSNFARSVVAALDRGQPSEQAGSEAYWGQIQTSLNSFLECLPDGLIAVEESGHVRVANDAARDLLRRAKALKTSSRGAMSIDASAAPELAGCLQAALQGRDMAQGELTIEGEGSSRLAIKAMGMPSPSGSPAVAIALLHPAPLVPSSSQQDDFPSLFAHELNNQMTIISGYCQLLQRRLKGSDPLVTKPLQIIETYLGRLGQMIDDLVDASRIRSGRLIIKREKVRLLRLLEEIRQVHSELNPECQLKLDIRGDPPLMEVDRLRIEQVLTNLISNAVKYTPEKETITIRLEAGKHEAIISVVDRGAGVPPQDAPRVFEAFFRGTRPSLRPAAGAGLGLYISRMIVQAHGGEITLQSSPGSGSTFQIVLPYKTPDIHSDIAGTVTG